MFKFLVKERERERCNSLVVAVVDSLSAGSRLTIGGCWVEPPPSHPTEGIEFKHEGPASQAAMRAPPFTVQSIREQCKAQPL